MLLMLLDHKVPVPSRTAPMNAARIVAGSIFANSVELVFKQPQASVLAADCFCQFLLSTFPCGQQSANSGMDNDLIAVRNSMPSFTNPQRDARTQTHRTELIQSASGDTNIVVGRSLLTRQYSNKDDPAFVADLLSLDYITLFNLA